MSRAVLALALALALPTSAHAQQPAAATDPGVAAMREQWRQVTAFVTAAAEELPEAEYAYRPVATVRTFGQLFGHVAGAQYMMCAAALGEPARGEDEIEKSATTKAALVQALKASTAYCARAYAQPAAATAATVELFGQRQPRAQVLALNAVHNGEHYGNIITYMRMKGMVPPSSRR
ncbi:MAG: DinB family protein [Gemmatirosa sp.]